MSSNEQLKKASAEHIATERTLVVIKPDGIHRGLVGEIIKRYEQTGLKLVGTKMLNVSEEFVKKHYTVDPEWIRKTGERLLRRAEDKGEASPADAHAVGTEVLRKLQDYFTSGPVIALVWQGAHAVAIARKITGGTEPLTSPIGSIRGDYVLDSYEMSDDSGRSVRNLVHASGTPDEAAKEIAHWFAESELVSYKHLREGVLYAKKMADF